MNYEKIIRQDDGSRVKIRVNIFPARIGNIGMTYSYDVLTCKKGGRTWLELDGNNSYKNRTKEDRIKMRETEKTLITPKEIDDAKLEAWDLLKPSSNNSIL
jgi:hypothetical protein